LRRVDDTSIVHRSCGSFSFDPSGKWIGINRNNLQRNLGPDGNEFNGTVKSSNRDLQEE